MKSVELEAVPDVLIRAFKFAEILDVFLRCKQVFRNVERLCLKGIDIRGQESEAIDAADVDVIIREVQE